MKISPLHGTVSTSVLLALFFLSLSGTAFAKDAKPAKKSTHLPSESATLLRSVIEDSGNKEVVNTDCFEKADVTVKLAVHKKGFHRNLETVVKVTTATDVPTSCHLMQMQTIPNGAYIDMYKIKSLFKGDSPKVSSFAEIDVEKPAYLSPPHSVIIQSKFNVERDVLDSYTTVPLELRYHRPSDKSDIDHATVVLKYLYFLLHCKVDAVKEVKSSNDSKESGTVCGSLYLSQCPMDHKAQCQWELLDYNNANAEISLVVPVGNQKHTVMVTVVTIVTTLLGGLVLFVAMLMSPKSAVHRHQD